jgi:hypothetical protein
VGRLNFVTGAVSFRPENVTEWAPATLNYPLTIGDHLWADQDGQAEVHVGSTAIRLASNTEISFLNLNDQTIQIRLSTGSLNLRLRHLGTGEEIELDTPNSSLSLLRAGSYRIDVQQNGDTAVTTRSGEIEVTAGSSVFPLRLQQTAAITGLDSPVFQVTDAAPLDSWDRWCQARDQKENQVASARYVPRDEIAGVEDLDQYGSWVQDNDLGPVWVPSVTIVGWAPYRFGHWAWVDPWGWTWIDDAPWGFAPFHYGRWAFRSSAWVWVPGTFVRHPVYAPAIVVFVGGGNWLSGRVPGGSVGWFPLGPHEPYIPPYHDSRKPMHNVDAVHFNYANRGVPGGVTVVPSEVFVRGQPISRSAFFLPTNELERAPVRRGVAPLVEERERLPGMIAAPGRVAQPPAWVANRAVVARLAPASPMVSEERRQALTVRPGNLVDERTLSNDSAPRDRPQVRVLTPGYPQGVLRQPSFTPGPQAGRNPAQGSFSPQYPAPMVRRPWIGARPSPQYPYPVNPGAGRAGTFTQVPPSGGVVQGPQPGTVTQGPARHPGASVSGRAGRTRIGSGTDDQLSPPEN